MKILDERIFAEALTDDSKELILEGKELHHLKVRHFKKGDALRATNGKALTALVTILDITSDKAILNVISTQKNENELSHKLSLALAVLKGSHFEDAIEKSMELGVSEIFPMITENTIKTGLKMERLHKIATSTLKQSRGSVLTQISSIESYHATLSQVKKRKCLNLFCVAHEDSQPIWDVLVDEIPRDTIVWIGPEGDWSKNEIQMAKDKQYKFVHLGARRLRAETAAIVATGAVSQWIH